MEPFLLGGRVTVTNVPQVEPVRLTPVLKWAGGKKWLVEELAQLYEPHKLKGARFVDPFVGGASIPLGLRPMYCLVSDVNPHLMNLYRWLQHGLVWSADTGIEFKNDRQVFYENRAKFNALCAARDYWTREGALLFYYLNRTCFNGLCRFNAGGMFNVPFGKYKSINYTLSWPEYTYAMQGWLLFSGDFSSLPTEPGDFLYIDPPYDVEFTQFAPRDFTWDDQERLAYWLARHPGPVVASNQATPRILQLYQSLGFSVRQIPAPRTISCNGDRTPAMEILATKGMG